MDVSEYGSILSPWYGVDCCFDSFSESIFILFILSLWRIHYVLVLFFFSEQRHLTDTQFRLVDNSNIQKQLNEAAEYAEMDLKAKQIDKNVDVSSFLFLTKQKETQALMEKLHRYYIKTVHGATQHHKLWFRVHTHSLNASQIVMNKCKTWK